MKMPRPRYPDEPTREWWATLAVVAGLGCAVMILIIVLATRPSYGGELIICSAAPQTPIREHWSWRSGIDGRPERCWFRGRMRPASELSWGQLTGVPQAAAQPPERPFSPGAATAEWEPGEAPGEWTHGEAVLPEAGDGWLIVKHSFLACPSILYEAMFDLDTLRTDKCRRIHAGERVSIDQRVGMLICVRTFRLRECVWIDDGVLDGK